MRIVYIYILIKKMPDFKNIFGLADWKILKNPKSQRTAIPN